MAYGGYTKGRVTIEQKFVGANPILLNPQLPACIIGPCYQIVEQGSSGEEYDWAAGNNGIAYPSLIGGNTVDTGSTPYEPVVYVKTKLSTGAYRTYSISSSDVTLNALNFDIASGIIKELIDWNLGYTGNIDGDGDQFTESSRTFFAYDIKAGDQVCFNSSEVAANQNPDWYNITSVSGANIFGAFSQQMACTEAAGGGTLVDDTTDADSATIDDMDLSVSAIEDAYYWGHPSFQFGKVKLIVSTADDSSGVYVWEYWNGAWTTLDVTSSTPVDHENLQTAQTGYITFTPPVDWVKNVMDVGGQDTNMYWMRVRTTTVATTTQPIGAQSVLQSFDASTAYVYEIRRKLGGTDSDLMIDYRALRADTPLLGLQTFSSVNDIEDNLGEITSINPLALGVYFAMLNTICPVYGIAVEDTIAAAAPTEWSDALTTIGQSEDVYGLVPLTQSTVIHGYMKTHVVNYSKKEVGRERITFVNRDLVQYDSLIDLGTSQYNLVGGFAPLVGKYVMETAIDITAKLSAGNFVYDETNDKFYLITAVAHDATDGVGEISLNTAPSLTDMTLLSGATRQGAFCFDTPNGKLVITDGETEETPLSTLLDEGTYETWIYKTDDGKLYHIESVGAVSGSPEDTEILISPYANVTAYSTPTTPVCTTTETWTVQFLRWDCKFVSTAYDKDEQAEQIATYAESIAERRVSLVWPDEMTYDDEILGADTKMDGFYIACCVAGMVSAYTPKQGFTNLSFSGPKSLIHSNGYFTDDLPGCQLDHMADGGVYIIVQASPGALPHCRHQLTTKMSSIKEMELQTTRCLDYSAKKYRNALKNDLGINNITNSYLSLLMGTAVKVSNTLLADGILTKAIPKNPTVSGFEVTMVIETDVPTPLNGIALVLYVQ